MDDVLLKPQLVQRYETSIDRNAALNDLVARIAAQLGTVDARELKTLLTQGDKTAHLTLGRSLAFSHARTDKVPELVIAMAVCPAGIAGFVPHDNQSVKILLLFLVPKKHSDLYLRAVSTILRQLSDEAVRAKLLSATQSDELVAALDSNAAETDLEAALANFATASDAKSAELLETFSRVPPAYLAELTEDLNPPARASLLSRLEPTRAAAVVRKMHLIPLGAAVRRMTPEAAARVLGLLSTAECADVLQQLKPEEQSAILKYLGVRSGRKNVQEILKYPPETAGGVMTPDVLQSPASATVAEALKTVGGWGDRRQTELYVVDTQNRLLGKCVIQDLLGATPETPVANVMHRVAEAVGPEMDQEEVRHLVARSDVRSVPVLGPHGTLLGVITQDDILDVIEEEAGEDLSRMVGDDVVDPLHTPIHTRFRMRLPWILLTLGGELFIALVITHIFKPTLEKAVVLAGFIPAIMATGGNVGLQSTTMVIRSLGMGTVRMKHYPRLIFGEIRLGVLTGLACGVIAAIAAYLINWNYAEAIKVSISVFLAMVSATLATSVVGTLEPLILHRLKFDPATACGPFVTMFNDIFGSLVFLLIAMLMNFSAPVGH